jgi:hypothetical protein
VRAVVLGLGDGAGGEELSARAHSVSASACWVRAEAACACASSSVSAAPRRSRRTSIAPAATTAPRSIGAAITLPLASAATSERRLGVSVPVSTSARAIGFCATTAVVTAMADSAVAVAAGGWRSEAPARAHPAAPTSGSATSAINETKETARDVFMTVSPTCLRRFFRRFL